MKKTLVFYSGRAPKGKRTNWVMHEYRTTLDDLDGTKPGQGAFVLLRLFKKDEIIEGSNGDVVDPVDLSPTTTKLGSEEVQSELEMAQESPSMGEEVEKNPANADPCLDDSSKKTTSNTVSPIQCNNYDAFDDAEGEHCATPTEVDWLLEEDLSKFYLPSLEPLDSKLFSPLHSQLQVELGSGMQYPVDSSCSGLEFQYGSNNYDPGFLNSVLNNPDQQCGDECGCWMNSTFESEAANGLNFMDVTQGPFEPELWSVDDKESVFEMLPRGCPPLIPEQSVCSAATDQPYNVPKSYDRSIDNVTSGIRLRARSPRNQMEMDKFITQGDAPKRIRLQCEIRRALCRKTSTVSLLKDEDYESKPLITKDEKAVEEYNSVAGSGIDSSTSSSTAGSREISLSESTEKSSLTSESNAPARKHKDVTFQFSSAAAASHQKNRPFRVLLRVAVILVLFSVSVSMRIVL